MKKRLLSNIGYKIASVILAVILWLVVMNISDYSITKTIEDIPVSQLNGEALEELDKIYDVAEGDTVDIIVKGRRSIVSELTAESFYATADLSTMSITNSVQIFVTPRNASLKDDISITCINNTMKLTLEEKITKQFPVKIKTTGEAYKGYAVGECTANPNIVTIEGPKSAVEKITEVSVNVSVLNARSNFDTTSVITLYDAYGEVITNDKLLVSHDEVSVSVNIYPVKEVDILVDVRGVPEDGFGVAEIIYQPQIIQVAGLPEDIEGIESIEIDDISISGLSEDYQTTIDLNDYMPEGVIVADNSSEIVITVDIEEVDEKTFSPAVKNITLTGKNNDYIYDVVLSDGFKIVASGLTNVIDGVVIADIAPTIDCTELARGENNVSLKLKDIEGVHYDIQGTVTVKVSAR
ncbi:MAG: hypothetical protein E7258_07245 [Lachnospiraceae bacterium]|nr:hypothetical protein [Lachnospiraceae bacterium]